MNWTTITLEDLKATGLAHVVEKAQDASTGTEDPAEAAIAQSVARVRRAITGSELDADPAKVPNSLKALTARMAVYALMERLFFPLSDDQREQRKADNSDLLRLSDKRIPVEKPDLGGGSAEMAPMGGVAAVNVPVRLTGKWRTSGL